MPAEPKAAGPLRVLLVEDSPRDAQLLYLHLEHLSDEVRPRLTHVNSLASATSLLAREEFDCVLLDLHLPDAMGVKGVQAIREAHRAVPIVVMTGNEDERCALDALRSGAQEYLIKGQFNDRALLRVLSYAIERNGVLVNIDHEREQARHFAVHDSLTGLPNRHLLEDRARVALQQAARRGERLALCFLDLDGFKPVNDRYGHLIGDAALQEVAEIFNRAVRASDTVARIGGDEFAAILCNSPDLATVQTVAQRIIEGVRAITHVRGRVMSLGVSIGVALYPEHGATLEELFANADAAMYQAKRASKGGVRFHQPGCALPSAPHAH